MDESSVRNLFVRAEMYVEQDVSNISAERLARFAADPNIDVDAFTKTARVKVIRNFVVPAVNNDGSNNEEYTSILGQVGYAAGATKGSQGETLTKGMETLLTFNDEQAQLAASASAINAQNSQQNNQNNQMLLDMQFMNTIEPVLIQQYGNSAGNELALLLDYVNQFPNERETILEAIQNGKIPYVSGNGDLNFEDPK